jgi:HTH-type transcriptional regulator/antitoxin MqsA
MLCPYCGEAEVVKQTRDMPYTYEGQSTIILAVTGEFCSACGECTFTDREAKRIGDAMLAFNRQAGAAKS